MNNVVEMFCKLMIYFSFHDQVALIVCTFAAVVMGYKLIILIFGLFLAYETRTLKLRFVNDSRLVGLAIYNVVCLTVVTGEHLFHLAYSSMTKILNENND